MTVQLGSTQGSDLAATDSGTDSGPVESAGIQALKLGSLIIFMECTVYALTKLLGIL